MSHQVIITQFVNPHLFYFSKINTPRYVYIKQKLSNIERKICAQMNSQSVPQVDQLVCVMYISWKRLIRGRVEQVPKNSSENEYLIWAIDYGFFFLTEAVHIFDLPAGCDETYNHIKRGGIAYLMPVLRSEYRLFDINKVFLEGTNNFSRNILENAYQIHYLHGFKLDGQYWGDLSIEYDDGTVKSMFWELKNSTYTTYHHTFVSECRGLITNKIFPRYVNTDRLNCKKNQFSAENRYLYEGSRNGVNYELHGNYEEDLIGNEIAAVSDDSMSSIDESSFESEYPKMHIDNNFKEIMDAVPPSGLIAIDIFRKYTLVLKVWGLYKEPTPMFSKVCDPIKVKHELKTEDNINDDPSPIFPEVWDPSKVKRELKTEDNINDDPSPMFPDFWDIKRVKYEVKNEDNINDDPSPMFPDFWESKE